GEMDKIAERWKRATESLSSNRSRRRPDTEIDALPSVDHLVIGRDSHSRPPSLLAWNNQPGCPLLALSGHSDRLDQCPLLGVKRTLVGDAAMSASLIGRLGSSAFRLSPAVPGDLHRPGLEPGPFCRT